MGCKTDNKPENAILKISKAINIVMGIYKLKGFSS